MKVARASRVGRLVALHKQFDVTTLGETEPSQFYRNLMGHFHPEVRHEFECSWFTHKVEANVDISGLKNCQFALSMDAEIVGIGLLI